MIRILLILWPALVPLGLYALWCVWRYRRKQAGHAVPPLTHRLYVTLVASILLAAVSFILLGVEQPANEGRSYVPTHYKDGVLVPGGMR